MSRQRKVRSDERHNMSAKLAVIPQDVARSRIVKASYGLAVNLSQSQRLALEETSLDRNLPAGRVLARQLSEPDSRGRDIEVLSGWHYLEAHGWETHLSPTVNVSLIEASDADAVHYAIDNAYEEAVSLGYLVSVIEYAEAVVRAKDRFTESIPTMTQMAQALRIGRTTLVNRVRLLDRLCYGVIGMVRSRQLPETAAKTLAAVQSEREQMRLAELYVSKPMSKPAFYALVNPGFQPKGAATPMAPNLPRPKGPDEVNLLNRIQARFGTPADLVPDPVGEGSELRLRFHSAAELMGLAQRLAMPDDVEGCIRGEVVVRSASNRDMDRLLQAMRVTEDDF